MTDISYFLKEGKQTLITPAIGKIAKNIKGGSEEKIKKLLVYISGLKFTGFDKNLFRKRTAEQILESGFVTGCTDSTVSFVCLTRACGIPAKYVETIDNNWLKSGEDSSIKGHQYAQIWIEEDKRWIWIDPMGGRINCPPPEKENRKIYKIGLDSWDLGLVDFQSLKKAFLAFKNKQSESKYNLAKTK